MREVSNRDYFAAAFAPCLQLELIRSFCSVPSPVRGLAARMLPAHLMVMMMMMMDIYIYIYMCVCVYVCIYI